MKKWFIIAALFFLSLGVPEAELQFHVVPGLGHEHLAWRKSVAMAYRWILER